MRGCIIGVLLLAAGSATGQAVSVRVEIEEEVYAYVNPENGSGPMWAYGSTEIARAGENVYVCQMETGADVPLLCNTRWRLLRRTDAGWLCIAEPDRYLQREPCPIAVLGDTLFLSVNDSTQPPGTKYGACDPHVLRFNFGDGGAVAQTRLSPVWTKPHVFTDHSYRGFAADPDAGRILMLNIDAESSEQNACLMTAAGEVLGGASVSFPIRACYPQVALRGAAAHVLAIGDIVEPVAEWKQYKFDQTQQTWDYVFRILYYTHAPDLSRGGFNAPIEIANADASGGAISNQDLWISPDGDAYILYTEREVASALLRDKFFPGKSIIGSLHLAVVKNGAVAARRVLYAGSESGEPVGGRFHVAADGTVYAVIYVTGPDAGNKLIQVHPEPVEPVLTPIPATHPLSSFCLAGVRAGNRPSDTIDMLGPEGDKMRYMRVRAEKETRVKQ